MMQRMPGILGLTLLLLPLLPGTASATLEEAVERRIRFLDAELSLDTDQQDELRALYEQVSRQGEARRDRQGPGERGAQGADGPGRRPGNGSGGAEPQGRSPQGPSPRGQLDTVLEGAQSTAYQELVGREGEWWWDPQLLQMDGMLGLSLEQCRRIHPVLRRSRIRLRSYQETARSTGDREDMERVRQEMQKTNETVLEFLDEGQQKIWRDHIDAMKAEMQPPRGGGAGRGGRGGF